MVRKNDGKIGPPIQTHLDPIKELVNPVYLFRFSTSGHQPIIYRVCRANVYNFKEHVL